MGVPVHQVKQFAPAFSLGCSISSRPYLALAMLDHPEHLPLVETHSTRMAVYYAMIVPEGEGRVRSFPGIKDPLVSYGLTGKDLATLATGLRSLCTLLLAAGATKLFPAIANQRPIETAQDLSSLPTVLPRAGSNLMTIHLFSSCRMGERADRCVTDSFGSVHGEERLHVSDASLLPSAPGVNPQGSVIAFARRNALHHCGFRPGVRVERSTAEIVLS
jgi:choline dehydrogenase-like flavoprotein